MQPDINPQPGPNGAELPVIYVPEHDTVYLGPANAYHWELINRSKALKSLYNQDSAWKQAPGLTPEGTDHIHGRMTWPDKEIHIIGGTPHTELLPRIYKALDAKPTPTTLEQPDWLFS